ncbi:hypothetical protein F5051DRAFT_339462 [Lentinula edodes]|nr:hypothetical protein F5051DRAFT_339462 [Lentinula edodes]
MWLNAILKNRKAIEQLYGTRYSELWRLPYWRLRQIGIDPMHTFFLILLQRYFRDILGLDNPDDSKKKPAKPRVQQVVCEVVTPAWVSNPPRNVGLYEAGVLKADHWRTLFLIHLPLAILSLWKDTSPLAAAGACDMASVVDTTMHLCCASLVVTKRKLTLNRREKFRHLLRLHILGLQRNFPGWIFPSHHLSFHIYDFMDLFSGVRHWWLFPFENLIGKLQRIPTNHKPGTI